MTRKVALTGSTGFVGGHLVPFFREEGIDVLALHRGSSISDMAGELQAFDPEAVIHLASFFTAEHTPEQVAPLIESNLLFGAQVLEAMRFSGVRSLINAGTSWQHFQGQTYEPVCLYASTKQAFEAMIEYYASAEGMRAITLKLFDTYGPGDTRPKLIPKLFSAIASNLPMELSPGEQLLNFLHVEDVVRAFRHALDLLPEVKGAKSFQVGAESELSLKQLVARIESVCGQRANVQWGGRPYRRREVMKPDVPESTSPRLPGWRPRISLESGLAQVWESSQHS